MVPPSRASPVAASANAPPAASVPSESISPPALASSLPEDCKRPLAATFRSPPACVVRSPLSAVTVPSTLMCRCADRLAGELAVTVPVTRMSRPASARSVPPPVAAVSAVPAVPAMRRSWPAKRSRLPLPCARPFLPTDRSVPALMFKRPLATVLPFTTVSALDDRRISCSPEIVPSACSLPPAWACSRPLACRLPVAPSVSPWPAVNDSAPP